MTNVAVVVMAPGWRSESAWGETRYVHEDDSTIEKLVEPHHGPFRGMFALYLGDPPTLTGKFGTPEAAMAEHAEPQS